VETPSRVPPEHEFSVQVSITGTPRGRSALLRGTLPDGGALIVSLYAPAFDLIDGSHSRQTLRLPTGDGPSRTEVGLRSRAASAEPEEIHVRAYCGGTPVGEVTVPVEVGPGRAAGETRRETTGVRSLTPGGHDAVLEVKRFGDRLELSLGRDGEPGEPFTTEPMPIDKALDDLQSELRRLAQDQPGTTGRRLRALGVHLWGQLFPPEFRDIFWSLPSAVTALNVHSDGFALPFELLHPLDGGNDAGFLVERFDVARPAGDRAGVRRVPARQVAFVRPRDAPANADAEFAAVTAGLNAAGTRVWRRPVTEAAQMDALLSLPTTAFHIVADLSGDLALRFTDDDFDHVDLSVARSSRSLSTVAPVVLLNACRSAAETGDFFRPTSWGASFMAAGAGAFVGTLWPVESEAALVFGEAFHRRFAEPGETVGAAVRSGREAVRKTGDAAWLAYTLHGSPGYGMSPAGGDG
jgi:hypothetical protein